MIVVLWGLNEKLFYNNGWFIFSIEVQILVLVGVFLIKFSFDLFKGFSSLKLVVLP